MKRLIDDKRAAASRLYRLKGERGFREGDLLGFEQDVDACIEELYAPIPEGVWEPAVAGTFWMVDWTGGVRSLNHNNRSAVSHHNVYKNESLARKASELQRRSNLVIQACLNFDPDFVPDWSDTTQYKHGFYYCYEKGGWARQWASIENIYGVYVSSATIADKVVDYLNSQKVK